MCLVFFSNTVSSQNYKTIKYTVNVPAQNSNSAYTITYNITPIGIYIYQIYGSPKSTGYNYYVRFNYTFTISGATSSVIYNGRIKFFSSLGDSAYYQLAAGSSYTNGTYSFSNVNTYDGGTKNEPSISTTNYTANNTYPDLIDTLKYTTVDLGLSLNGYATQGIGQDGSEDKAEYGARSTNITTSSTALPIRLLSFTVTENNTSNILNWQTAVETNNNYFVIEKSTDGNNFDSIGTVKGAGNSDQTLSYSYTDDEPVSGTNYYRLKQVDFDGNYTYSSIASIYYSGIVSSMDISIYPNPGKGTINIKGNWNNLTSVRVVSMLGQVVYVGNITTSSFQLPTNLVKGLYIINFYKGSKSIKNLKYILY
ncbi:T9SS type A sorting domain-containing protein [Rhizosphaericola mali]|nr:T9SS type A sorting domain-containing protein [Rhizosphaericola mali]